MQGAARWSPGNSFNMVALRGSMVTRITQWNGGAFIGVCKMALLLPGCAIIFKYDKSSQVLNTVGDKLPSPATFSELQPTRQHWLAAASFPPNTTTGQIHGAKVILAIETAQYWPAVRQQAGFALLQFFLFLLIASRFTS